MSKVRKVDFSPDEFIAGTNGMMPDEIGVYWTLCARMYSQGGPLPDEIEILVECFSRKLRPTTLRKIINGLIAKGKIFRCGPAGEENLDGNLYQSRVKVEINSAVSRMESASNHGKKGGRPHKENNELTKPSPFSDEKLSPPPSPPPDIEKNDKTETYSCAKSENLAASDAGCVSDLDDDQKPVSGHVETKAERARQLDAEFDAWWQFVPLKKAKGGAKVAFGRARKLASLDVLSAAMRRYAAECAGREDRYIAHPATWLNQQRWLDEPAKPNGARHNGNGYYHGKRTESALDYCLRKSGFGSDLEEDFIPH